MRIKLLQHTLPDADTNTSAYRMPIQKLALLNRDSFVFVPESWLVIYYEHRQSMLILKADFCIFGFVYDEAISINQCWQHKNPNTYCRATVFAKDNAADLLLQKVTQYANKL